MSRPAGYSLPLAPDGRASLVPRPPWHYVGDFMVIEYRTDPDAITALLPPGFEPAREPDRACALFVDWQSCSDGGEELLDPSRSQYREFFVVVGARVGGEDVSHCPYIWVDRDFALIRGWVQGFPKKLGSIWMTRPVPFGLAGPRLEAGGRFGATCAAYERRLAEGTITLEGLSETGPTVNDPPLHNVRHFPRIDDPDRPALWEVVRASSTNRSIGPIWEGSATLEFTGTPHDGLDAIAPRTVERGFWFQFAYTVEANEIVATLGGEA
jgi:acetoacetate decarboxylase